MQVMEAHQMASSSDEESNCAQAGSDKEENGQVKMCRLGMGGAELEAIMLERDATVGQLKSKVLRLSQIRDERIDLCWFRDS